MVTVAVEKSSGNAIENVIASQDNLFDIVDLVAASPNVMAADDIISAFFPNYDEKEKFEFLKRSFKFHIVGGSSGAKDSSSYYKLVMQYILCSVRDFGIASVKK